MLAVKQQLRKLSTADRAEIDRVVQRFEEAWTRKERPSIDEHLTLGGPHRLPLLIDLVHTELEFRLRAGEVARVESYLKRYPELSDDPKIVLDFIAAEYEQRQRQTPAVTFEECIQEYNQRFPHYGEELKQRLKPPAPPPPPVLRRLNCPYCQEPIQVVDSGTDESVTCRSCGSTIKLADVRDPSWLPERLPQLEKFKLLAKLGHGSFGTVYYALDTVLRRFVAVKLPRSGHSASQEDMDRFGREARIMAQLKHPGVVGVYELGWSNGAPYIVSEYVEGLTLKDATSGHRFSFRESAEIVAQVAEALASVHPHVVHRDLKPSNIMMDRTEAGNRPRITDFGLAWWEQGDVFEGGRLGTVPYLSPEQARGDRHVDGRSDVYSLGVILYELLVGKRPFRGKPDRVLRHIKHKDPRPPRKLDKRIPRDLEAISLICMAKDASERYQAAGELAEDLRRYLAGKPIERRRVGPAERFWLWAKRNPVVAGLSGALAFLLVMVAVGSTVAALRIAAAKAEAARFYKEWSATIDRLFTATAEGLADPARAEAVRKRLYEEAAEAYQHLAGETSKDPEIRLESGRVLVRLGRAQHKAGDLTGAEQSLSTAQSRFESLLSDFGETTERRYALATTLEGLGSLFADLPDRDKDAEDAYKESIKEFRQLVGRKRNEPTFHFALASTLVNFGQYHCENGRHRYENAKAFISDALEEFKSFADLADNRSDPDYLEAVAKALRARSAAQSGAGQYHGAIADLKAAEDAYKQLVEVSRKVRFRAGLAGTHAELAFEFNSLGYVVEAEQQYRASIETYVELTNESPDDRDLLVGLAASQAELASLLHILARDADAEDLVNESIREWQELVEALPIREWQKPVEALPMSRYRRAGLAFSRAILGEVLRDQRKNEQSHKETLVAVELLEPLNYPQFPEYVAQLANYQRDLGRVLRKLGDADGARRAYDSAIGEFKKLIKEHGERPYYIDGLAATYALLGELFHFDDADESRKDFEIARDLWVKLAKDPNTTPEYGNTLAWFLATCPDPKLHDPKLAVQVAKKTVEAAPENPRYLTTLGVACYRAGVWNDSIGELGEAVRLGGGNSRQWFFLATAEWQRGNKTDARNWYDKAVEWMEKNSLDHEELLRFRDEAAKLLGIASERPADQLQAEER